MSGHISNWQPEKSVLYKKNLEKIDKQRQSYEEQITNYRDYIIGSRLPRIKPQSFYRWADKNLWTPILNLNYLSKKGQSIDQYVFDLNQVHGENYFCEQDIIDFILKYQTHNPFKGK